MVLPSKIRRFLLVIIICLSITSCGGNGCKYPDEIAAGGIWTETQTTVVRPINRNIIASEQGNGEYTLKDGTNEDIADSNLWVPLRLSDGTYAKVEAGKKVKLSVSGSVVLAGYSYNTDVTFKDWIAYGSAPYSFAEVTQRTAIDEDEVEVIKIEKERKFYQNGLQSITYSYYGKDGIKRTDDGELIKIGCDLTLTNEERNIETAEDNIYINYAFLYPAKIVFSRNFFISYTTDANKHIVSTTKTSTGTKTIDSTNNLTASVEKFGPADYRYIYDFQVSGKNYRYYRKLVPEKKGDCYDFDETLIAIDCEEDLNNNCILSRVFCGEIDANTGNQDVDRNKNKCTTPDRTFIIADTKSPVMIYFKKYANIGYNATQLKTYGDDGRYNKYFYSPTYAVKNRIPITTSEYKNRFAYNLYNTGASSGDNVKYQGNCRIFPQSITYAPAKVSKDISSLTEMELNKSINMDNCNVVTLREYCSKHCLDLCTHYFSNTSDNCGMFFDASKPADDYISEESKLLHFIHYTPIGVTVSQEELVNNSDCYCNQWSHAFESAKNLFSIGTLRKDIYELCTSSGYSWGGLVYTFDGDVSSTLMNYNAVKNLSIGNFSIAKMAYGTNSTSCKRHNSSMNTISTGICSPYDRITNNCGDVNLDHCAGKAGCRGVGMFNAYNSNITKDSHCPYICEKVTNFETHGNGSKTETTSFDVVARIDYYEYPLRNNDPRKSSNIDDQDNSIYYMINDGKTISVSGYQDIEDGLLAISGPDVIGIKCNDEKIPSLNDNNLFTSTTTYYKTTTDNPNGQFSSCKVKGKYKSTEVNTKFPDSTNVDISLHLYYNEQKQGILPIKWSTFTVHPGDILPLSITSAESGASPPLVKTNNCLLNNNSSTNCYTQLRNGNGLIIVLEPTISASTSTVPAVDEDIYKNPNLWFCNYGLGGSYGSYNPYRYNENAIGGVDVAGISLSLADNPRNIMTKTSLTWQCDEKGISYWFTGYDYKGIKLKSETEHETYKDTLIDENGDDVYPSPHIYSIEDLNRFVPDYGNTELEASSGSTGIVKIDCASDGVPDQIEYGGTTYTKASNNLYINYNGSEYVYQYYDGTVLKTTKIDEVTSASYPTEMPNRIIVKFKDAEGNETQKEIDKSYNNLTRSTCTDGDASKDYCYFYTITYRGDYAQDVRYNLPECKCEGCTGANCTGSCATGVNKICSYEKRVYDDDILGAYCQGDPSDLTVDVTSSSIVTSVTTDSCGNSCKVIDDTQTKKEIFTAYGPFAGMNADNANAIMPAIYDGYHACRGNANEKQFIYDTQKAPNANTIFQIITLGLASLDDGVERKPLDVYWRMEFTNPTLENKSSYKGSYNSVDTTCGVLLEPDIMFVDLTNTNEWSLYATGATYPQTVLIYKSINALTKISKVYYTITHADWSWTNKVLAEDDYRILAIGETCGLHENCGAGEMPNLKIINNSEVKVLIDSNSYPSDGNSTIRTSTDTTYEFYYNGKKYTIPEKKVATTTKICNIADQQSWLSALMTVGEKSANDGDSGTLGNLGKAPFIVACDNDEDIKQKFKYGYTSLKNLSNNTTNELTIKSMNDKITDGISVDKSLTQEDAFVIKTQNKSFLSSQYFARCTTNWQTPGWMLLNRPGDFSSFNVENNAISGSFVAPPNQSLTWDDIKTKYSIEKIWAKHGGMIRNVVYNNVCDEYDVPTTSDDNCNGNCGKMYSNCKQTSESQYTPKFTTHYNSQMIAVRTLANDPINTTDTDCDIVVKASGTEIGRVTIKANEPFGQVVPTSMISSMTLQNDDIEKKENPKHSIYRNSAITINGGLEYKNNFFKRTEFYRNIIGAGIVKSDWHFIKNGSTNPVVIEKDKTITIEPSNETFYAMGNLSHNGKAYCWPSLSEDVAAAGFYTAVGGCATACAVGVATGNGKAACSAAGLVLEGAEVALVESGKHSSKHKGAMTPISNGSVAKRQCGTGMAFRIVEVPSFACVKGYSFACTNKRITEEFRNSPNMETEILKNCISNTKTDYSSDVTIGKCEQHKVDILSGLKVDSIALAYSKRYSLNSFKEQKSTDAWSEIENIDEQQCGLCLPKDKIEKYDGINYYTGSDYPSIPDSIKNISQCNTYEDNEGNKYTFVTSLARITPFNKYGQSEQESIHDDIDNIFSTEIHSCSTETNNSYKINFSNKNNIDAFENIFQKISMRNEGSCIALLASFYNNELKQANVGSECETAILANINDIAKKGCNKLLTYVEGKDGKNYDMYKFTVNQTYTYCGDDKDIIDTSKSPIISITRANSSSDSLQNYLFAELTNDLQNQASDIDSALEVNVHIPEKLKINGTLQNYDKANVGFAIAGSANDNPMLMYSNFKLNSPSDLNRGYSVKIGNGIVSRNGKYLYYYIQQNDANGNPDPLYDPNTHFNLHAPNPHGKLYVKNYPPTHVEGDNMIEILTDPTIHHFADEDIDKDGNITFTAPDSGTLWFAVLDVDEKDPTTGDSISNEKDGKAIIFRDALDLKVDNVKKNVLGTNSGYYMVKGKIQSESFDIVDEMLSMDGTGGSNIVHETIFKKIIINPIRTLLFGTSDFKNLTYENILSKKYEGVDETALTDEQKNEKEKIDKLNTDLKKGLLFQLLQKFFSFHLVHILYYIAVTGGVIIFGGKVLLGMQKIDFKTIFKYTVKFSFIALILHPDAIKVYTVVFVKTALAISDGFIMMVASNFTDRVYTADDSGTALSVAFGPVDSIIRFWLKTERIEQLLAILCSSWFGWLSVIVLLLGTVHFILSAFEALAVYIITLMNLFLELALGPIYFIFLLFDKTAGKFTKWLKDIGALIAQQTAMFSALAIFATIYYHILKGTLNFTYCWEPIIKLPVLDIPLFSCWRIAGNLPVAMAELMGDYAPTGKAITGSTGFSPLTALCLYLLTVTMSKFIDKSVKFGGDLFGGGSQTAQAITGAISTLKDKANSGAGKVAESIPEKISKGTAKSLDKVTRGSVEQVINHFKK